MATTEDGNDDAWSREVEALPPIEFDVSASSGVPAGKQADTSPRSPTIEDTEPRARRWQAVAGATVALLVIGTVLVVTSSSDDVADGPATSEAPPTTLSRLPATPAPQDDEQDEQSGELDFDGQLEQFPQPGRSDGFSALPATWREGSIDVPEGLGDIGPTTVVVLTEQGVLREVDFPSGVTRDFPIGDFDEFTPPRISVGRSATLVSDTTQRGNPGGQPFSLLRPGEPPVKITVPLQASETLERPGTDEFVGLGVDLAASSLERITIGADGGLTTTVIKFGLELSSDGLRYSPSGNTLIADGGAVFERTPDGTTSLIAEGELIATSSHHVLTRDCDEQYECTGVLVDGATGQRSTVQLDPDFVPGLSNSSADVSPDGRWLRYGATALRFREQLLDLRSGEITVLPVSSGVDPTLDGNDVWATDSSGFFRFAQGGLEFYDVTSAGTVALQDAVGSVVAYGVRLDVTGVPEPPVINSSGIELLLVAVDQNGTFHDLDLATGEVISFPISDSRTVFGRSIVVTEGDDAYALAADRGPSALLDRRVGAAEEFDDPFDRTVYRGPKNDTIWRPIRSDERVGLDPDGYLLVDTTGTSILDDLMIPDGLSIVGGDVSGGLIVVSEAGDVSLLWSDSVELLTSTGELLGLGSSTIIVRECAANGDGDGECSDIRIDRGTGERTPTRAPTIATAQLAITNGSGKLVESTVSPDGDVLIGPTSDSPLQWIATDLEAGTVIDVGSIRTGSRIAWTADSSYAVFQSGEALFVYDRAAAQIVELVDAPPVVGFAGR